MNQITGLPGVQSERSFAYRSVRKTDVGAMYLPRGGIIDASNSRDPGNTNYEYVLRAGMLMGRVTSNNLYAPSIIGTVAETIDGSETALTLNAAATITEIVRRIGSTGTVTITGSSGKANTVYETSARSMTATFSAASGTTLTITALGTSGVWTLNAAAGADAGTFKLRIIAPNGVIYVTTAQAYNVATATMETELQALIPDTGAGITVTGTAGSEYIITFNRDTCPGNYIVEVFGDSVIDSPVSEGGYVATHTTVGVDGTFATGALVQPTDGSQTPIALIDDGTGVRVVDQDLVNVDVPWPTVLIGGILESANIINWPTASTPLKNYIKDSLNSRNGSKFVFDDGYTT